MIQSGQAPIRSVVFDSRRHPGVPVEVLDRREIVSAVTRARLASPERLAFHELILMRSAGGSHRIDFTAIEARPARFIRARPGQVQAWDPTSDYEATVVLSQPAPAARDPWFPGDSSYRDLDAGELALADSLITALRREQERFDDEAAARHLMTTLFDALVALHDRARPDGPTRHLPPAYVAFRTALEADLAFSHDVTDHAARLGYSPRTLDRATRLATGQSAKRALTERLILEAKRLLVHTDVPIADVAAAVGYPEATNFSKAFARDVGVRPSDFRRRSGRPV